MRAEKTMMRLVEEKGSKRSTLRGGAFWAGLAGAILLWRSKRRRTKQRRRWPRR